MLSALSQAGLTDFCLQYFQTPGLAEAELERDVGASIRRIHFGASGEGQALLGRPVFGAVEPDRGFVGDLVEPSSPPEWWHEADMGYCTAEFTRTGFRGGLNWYRNMKRSWELLTPWRGQVIRQPSMFIAGASDDVLKFPSSKPQIENFRKTLPGLRGCQILEGAGHWIPTLRAAVSPLQSRCCTTRRTQVLAFVAPCSCAQGSATGLSNSAQRLTNCAAGGAARLIAICPELPLLQRLRAIDPRAS